MRLRGSRTLWVTSPPKLRSLQTQLILSILLAVVLAAAIAGIPTLWLIHQQLDRQAWAQVDGGLQAARALYDAKQEQISNLARLAAQRPSLKSLLAEGDSSEDAGLPAHAAVRRGRRPDRAVRFTGAGARLHGTIAHARLVPGTGRRRLLRSLARGAAAGLAAGFLPHPGDRICGAGRAARRGVRAAGAPADRAGARPAGQWADRRRQLRRRSRRTSPRWRRANRACLRPRRRFAVLTRWKTSPFMPPACRWIRKAWRRRWLCRSPASPQRSGACCGSRLAAWR